MLTPATSTKYLVAVYILYFTLLETPKLLFLLCLIWIVKFEMAYDAL